MKILITFPIDDQKLYCFDEFIDSLIQIQDVHTILAVDTSKNQMMFNKFENTGIKYASIPFFPKAMDRVVAGREFGRRYAIENGFDYALFLDGDIIAPPTIINDLLKHNKEVISALAFTIGKDSFPTPCCKIYKEETDSYYEFPREAINGELHEIGMVGFGACLIKTEVLNRVNIRCERDKGKLLWTEDNRFSFDCRRLGIKMYIDTNTQVRHKINKGWNWEAA